MIVIYRLNEPRVGKDGIGWVGQEPPGSYPKSHRAYNECTKCCDTTPMVGKQCCMYPWTNIAPPVRLCLHSPDPG